jgi:selenide,water dikinase
VLVLSKPIGTGIVLAGGEDADKAAAIASMRMLNRSAAEALSALVEPPHAVTDVTGFGLAGHAWEVAERSAVGVDLDVDRLPLYAGARAAAEAGTRTGGDPRNRAYLGERVAGTVDPALEALCFDPQTSGGLLAAVTVDQVDELAPVGFVPVGRVVRRNASVRLV